MNSSHFEIERSYDNLEFETIGEVDAAGNSQSIIDYTYYDNSFSTANKVVYYRLNQVDVDGANEKSEVRIVKLSTGGKSVEVFPNPANNKVTIASASNYEMIEIFTMDGARVKAMPVNYEESIDISLESLRSGTYLIKASNKESVEYKRLLVVH